ncbi:MAG: InlB B-repeat-containing protein [Clostridia bacterium]|nr:InlB B-repeat-containing protein [Clostridia bacterium]
MKYKGKHFENSVLTSKKLKGKHFDTNKILKTGYKDLNYFLLIIIILMMIATSFSDMLAYFTYADNRCNAFSIDAEYQIEFNANTGTGTMSNQTISYNVATNLNTNTYTKSGFAFDGWNTEPDGSGTSYADGEAVTNLIGQNNQNVVLYAQWTTETNVAEVVGVGKYETLHEAITVAQSLSGHQTVRLLKNIELATAVTISQSKNITLDLQNYTLKNQQGSGINIIINKGTLEIVGGVNGTITSDAAFGTINNEDNGHLTVSSGNIIATGERQAIYNSGATVEITGTAYLESSASDRATIQNYKPNNKNAGTITISGGTIVSKSTTTKGAVQNEVTGTVIVTGGTIISENNMGIDNAATLIIGTEDDDIDVTTPTIQGVNYGVRTTGTGTVEFYNGTVKGQTHAFNDENYITDTETDCSIGRSTETISGDTYETAFLNYDRLPITFNANGGTPAETIVHIDYNTAIGANMPQNPTRTHYTFDGWYTDPDPNAGTQITSATVVTSRETYYAHWTKTEAEVTFNANGGTMDGTNEEETVVVNIGSSIGSVNLPTPTRHYKSFVGWYTDPNGGTLIDGTETILQDVTYYAHWTAQMVTVNFDPNTGTIPQVDASRTVAAGDPVGTLPTTATKANQNFVGWYTDPTDGTKIDENEIIGDTTVTFYAHWISNAVARIGAVHYAKLQDAIDDVPTDNTQTTITMIKDDLEAVYIAANKNIILDLDGHKLYNDGSKNAKSMNDNSNRPSVIENLGTLKIMNGTMTANSKQPAINTGTGDVIIENVTITHTGTSSQNVKQAISLHSGTLTITGNSVLSANNSGTYGGYNRGVIQVISGTARILGGTITSATGPGIVNQAGGTLILGTEDGTAGNTTPVIQSKTYGVLTSGTGSTFNFYDGIVKGITGSISGTVADYEDGALRVDTTEVINPNTYQVTYYTN